MRSNTLAGVVGAWVVLMSAHVVPAKAQLQTQQVRIEDVRVVAAKAATEWSATRGCGLPRNGNQVVAEKMTTLVPAVSAKRLKYNLRTEQQARVVTAFTTAYLDSLSKQAGPLPESCFISLESIQSTQFSAVFLDPDSGVLEVDGNQKKADIYIDGSKKGLIKQAFALSAGRHTWKTMKCDDVVQIAPNDNKQVYCSKQ